MTVPFDPKPSAALQASVLTPGLFQAASVIMCAASDATRWAGQTITTEPHRQIQGLSTILRNAADDFDLASECGPAHRMVDGDLWHQEPAVMHPGDIGEAT